MSRRFLDVFSITFLSNLVMIIIILILYLYGINVIGDVVLTLLLVAIASITASYTIYKWYISSINSLSYELGATNAGNEYKKTLANIAKKFQSKTLEIYNSIPEAKISSFEDFKKYLYLKAYVDSRNELIEELVKAFDELNDFSSDDLTGTKTK